MWKPRNKEATCQLGTVSSNRRSVASCCGPMTKAPVFILVGTLMKSLCRRHFFRLASLWRFAHLLRRAALSDAAIRDVSCCSIRNTRSTSAMLEAAPSTRPGDHTRTDVRGDRASVRTLRRTRDGRESQGQSADRIRRLDRCNACAGRARAAAMEASTPRLRGRRMASVPSPRQPRLPLDLDELAEAGHEILPLAILIAFLQARRATAAERPTGVDRGAAGSGRYRATRCVATILLDQRMQHESAGFRALLMGAFRVPAVFISHL